MSLVKSSELRTRWLKGWIEACWWYECYPVGLLLLCSSRRLASRHICKHRSMTWAVLVCSITPKRVGGHRSGVRPTRVRKLHALLSLWEEGVLGVTPNNIASLNLPTMRILCLSYRIWCRELCWTMRIQILLACKCLVEILARNRKG